MEKFYSILPPDFPTEYILKFEDMLDALPEAFKEKMMSKYFPLYKLLNLDKRFVFSIVHLLF